MTKAELEPAKTKQLSWTSWVRRSLLPLHDGESIKKITNIEKRVEIDESRQSVQDWIQV